MLIKREQGLISKKPRFFYGYIIVLVSFCIMLAVVGTFYSFGVFFEPILVEFGWTRGITSGAYSLCILLSSCVGLVAGKLSDRLGPRFILGAGGLFSGAGYLLMAQISTVWQVYLFFGLIEGIGIGCTIAPLLSTIPRWFVKKRGLMMGLFLSSCGLGTMIIPPVATQFILNYGWRFTFVVIGGIILVTVIVGAQFLKREPSQIGQLPYGEKEAESLDLQHKLFSFRQVIRISQFWMLAGIYASTMFCAGIIFLHIVPHMTSLGTPVTTAANVLAVIGGVGIAGRFLMGAVADRIGNKPPLLFGLVMMTACLLWLLIANELWMFYLFAVIFGFAYGNLIVLESPLGAELFGLGSLGMLVAGVEFVSSILMTPSPIVAGYIYDITSSYQLAFLLAILLSVMALLLALFLKPTKSAQAE